MIKQFILINLYLLFHCLATEQFTEEEITLKTKTGDIHGSLLIPQTVKSSPLAIIISGSGPTNRNGNNPWMKNNSLKMLAEGLGQNKIASLRYDKRGIAQSQKAGVNESLLRFEHYISDLNAWVKLFKQDQRFSKIILVGHSEGALIATVSAQLDGVHSLVSLAGIGRPLDEVLITQLQAQTANISKPAIEITKKLKRGQKVETVPAMLHSLFRPSVQDYLISVFKYDPKKEVAKLTKKVLIIQGDTDIQVTVNDAKILAEAAQNSQLKIIKGMNHILKDSSLERTVNIATYSQPNLPLNKKLIQQISQFIND